MDEDVTMEPGLRCDKHRFEGTPYRTVSKGGAESPMEQRSVMMGLHSDVLIKRRGTGQRRIRVYVQTR